LDNSLATFLSISGAFGAAAIAQIISHKFTLNREDKKYKKEAFQNLYSPTLFKILEYIETEGYNHSSLEPYPTILNTGEKFKEASTLIGSNLKYAEVDLINSYHDILGIASAMNIQVQTKRQDQIKDLLISEKIKLSNIFLTQYLNVSKELKLDLTSVNEKINVPLFFSHVFLLLKESSFIHKPSSKSILKYYQVMDYVLISHKQYPKRIIEIRRNLYNAMNKTSHTNEPVITEALSNTYGFFYEFTEKFEEIDLKLADYWKSMIDEQHSLYLRWLKS
jgi:hypothetical protein